MPMVLVLEKVYGAPAYLYLCVQICTSDNATADFLCFKFN